MIVHDAAQGSLAWHRARLGLPTASMAASLVTPTGRASSAVEGYADRLAMQRYRGAASDAFAGSDATARGHAFEPRARAAYAWLVGTDVRECGFCTDDRGRFGGSPDGLIGEDGGLEIKCPLMPAFVAALMHVEEHGRAPAVYLPQVHMLDARDEPRLVGPRALAPGAAGRAGHRPHPARRAVGRAPAAADRAVPPPARSRPPDASRAGRAHATGTRSSRPRERSAR